ncbi:MAG: DUF423 domain-containing protein [Candidatus Sumerlaeaceae bacterium]
MDTPYMSASPRFRRDVAMNVFAALNGLLAVVAGAFAAHSLRRWLDASALELVRTAAHYEMIHALAILAVGAFFSTPGCADRALKLWRAARFCFTVGIVLFSGSLYFLAFTKMRALGLITPFGGLAFIAGWLLAAAGFLQLRSFFLSQQQD